MDNFGQKNSCYFSEYLKYSLSFLSFGSKMGISPSLIDCAFQWKEQEDMICTQFMIKKNEMKSQKHTMHRFINFAQIARLGLSYTTVRFASARFARFEAPE